MNAEQYELLTRSDNKNYIHVNEVSGPDRTLIFGYNTDRTTFHLYKKNGMLHRYFYDYNSKTIFHEEESSFLPEDCISSKRVYPEDCDFEFCKLLLKYDVLIPFTGFNEERLSTTLFKGEIVS